MVREILNVAVGFGSEEPYFEVGLLWSVPVLGMGLGMEVRTFGTLEGRSGDGCEFSGSCNASCWCWWCGCHGGVCSCQVVWEVINGALSRSRYSNLAVAVFQKLTDREMI